MFLFIFTLITNRNRNVCFIFQITSEQGKIVLNYKSIGRYMVEGCNIPIIILRLIDYKGGMPS